MTLYEANEMREKYGDEKVVVRLDEDAIRLVTESGATVYIGV